MNSVVYPVGQETQFRTLSVTLSLTATTVISYCFAQRAYNVDFFSRRGLSSINITKWLLLLIFADSWAFVFLSGLLVNGVGMSLNEETCSLGIFICIVFYCVSKLLTYTFLLEKVYVVWPSKRGRWGSNAYRVGFCALLGFVVVLIMMIVGRIAFIQPDQQCIIGLQKAASMTTLFVDLFVNMLLTFLFLWPLFRSNLLSPNLRRVAARTLVASVAALTISAINLAILTIVHGQELGWVCLASCSTDVVVNAMVIFWLTRPGQAADEPTSHGGYGGSHAPGHYHGRSENGKSVGGNTAVIQMQNKIPVSPGSFSATASFNGASRISSALRTPADVDGSRSPMKVNFGDEGYSGIYDGSRPHVRGGDYAAGLVSPTEEKYRNLGSLPTTPTSAILARGGNHPPSFFKDQKRHSTGFMYETTVSTASPERQTFLDKLMGRRSPSVTIGTTSVDTALRSGRSVSGNFTLGAVPKLKKKNSKKISVEDMAIHITTVTKLEIDEETLAAPSSSSLVDTIVSKEAPSPASDTIETGSKSTTPPSASKN